MKHLSEYEQCKLECKRKRDQVNAQEYVEQLTEELRIAKEFLATQQREAAATSATSVPAEPVQTETIEGPPLGQHLEDVPHVPKPIIEVTLHQTAKDEI